MVLARLTLAAIVLASLAAGTACQSGFDAGVPFARLSPVR